VPRKQKKPREVAIIEAERDADISKIWAKALSQISISTVQFGLLVLLLFLCAHYNYPKELSAIISSLFGLNRLIPSR
jgi:hypothetical protein